MSCIKSLSSLTSGSLDDSYCNFFELFSLDLRKDCGQTLT